MSAFAYRQRYELPHGFAVEFTLDGPMLQCVWEPDLPKGKRAKQLRQPYREARNRFIASLGVAALVVEV